MTDFGIEESFRSASLRMKEHHGVEINVSAIRRISEWHAERAAEIEAILPQEEQESKQRVMEMDGEIVSLVEYGEAKDRRKTKKTFWSELRIGVAQSHKKVSWEYACSFKDSDELGDHMRVAMTRIG